MLVRDIEIFIEYKTKRHICSHGSNKVLQFTLSLQYTYVKRKIAAWHNILCFHLIRDSIKV